MKKVVLVDRLRLLHLFDTLNVWAALPRWGFVMEAVHTGTVAAT